MSQPRHRARVGPQAVAVLATLGVLVLAAGLLAMTVLSRPAPDRSAAPAAPPTSPSPSPTASGVPSTPLAGPAPAPPAASSPAAPAVPVDGAGSGGAGSDGAGSDGAGSDGAGSDGLASAAAAAPPVRVAAPSVGLDAPVQASASPQVGAGTDLATVTWWTERGTPGPITPDTVFLAGHAREPGAGLQGLAGLAAGDTVVLTTETGRLTYRVESSQVLDLGGAGRQQAAALAAGARGRLVLIGCHGHGEAAGENLAVVAALDE